MQTVPATAQLGPGKTGLAIGIRVLNLDGTTYSVFSTTDVAETSVLGTYRKANGAVVPDAGGTIVWGVSGTDYIESPVDPASPTAAAVGSEIWTGTYTRQINSVSSTISANLVQMNGDTDPVDNLVSALGTGGLVEKLNSMLEAAGLAYRFTAAALAEGPVSTAPSTTDIDTALSATHGAGAWGAGTGVFSKAYTVTSGGLPVDGVYCRLTTDAAGLVNVDAGTTNAAGQVTFHHNLAAGTTVYIHRSKAGFTPVAPEPDVEVI